VNNIILFGPDLSDGRPYTVNEISVFLKSVHSMAWFTVSTPITKSTPHEVESVFHLQQILLSTNSGFRISLQLGEFRGLRPLVKIASLT